MRRVIIGQNETSSGAPYCSISASRSSAPAKISRPSRSSIKSFRRPSGRTCGRRWARYVGIQSLLTVKSRQSIASGGAARKAGGGETRRQGDRETGRQDDE